MTLFIIQPFASHYYPTFSLATHLEKNGEEVLYTTTSFLTETLTTEGFAYHELEYLSEYMINSTRGFIGFLLKSMLSNEFYKTRLEEFKNAYQAILTLVAKYQPTQIYLDQSLADYYFFLKPHVPKIIILHTKVYSGEVKGLPPMNSTYIPKNVWYSKLICKWKWFQLLARQRWNELLLKAAFLGKDEIYFWKMHCKEHSLDWQKETDFKHALNRGIKGVDSLVLCPKELEFSNAKLPENINFYERSSQKNEGKYFSKDYVRFKKNLVSKKDKMVIYLSFGTLSMGQKRVERFFNEVISIFTRIENTELIVSKGRAPLRLKHSKNSTVLDFVPQQDVLSYAKLFITHGGLGSVKEAYYARVPMLVVPLNTRIDQPGNAARVKAHGLGDILDLDNYNKKELEEKIVYQLSKSLVSTRQAVQNREKLQQVY